MSLTMYDSVDPSRIPSGASTLNLFTSELDRVLTVPRLGKTTVGWVAGIIEGEGCITIRSPRSSYTEVRLAVQMTDRDVILALRDKTGLGTVCGPRCEVGRKDLWSWSVTQSDQLRYLLTAIAPLMGSRRRAKIEEAIPRLPKPPKNRTHGTRTSYAAGCRCQTCKDSNTARHRKYLESKS